MQDLGPLMMYGSFRLLSEKWLEELQATYLELIHPSGFRVVKIANEDPENSAAILFETLPTSSNGLPHILEHVVLCGSKKFPVKDPFFSITRRSLAPFANAFTAVDVTCYPFSAYIKEDFYNLFAVYLDAVFHPLLKRESFLQEGWRLTSQGYKGIVLNEMIQARSHLYDRIVEGSLKALFPTTAYGYNSGGIPSEIIHLTYEELCEFHKKNYTPKRSILYLYGNLPLEEQLCFLEKELILKAESEPGLSHPSLLKEEPSFAAPKEVVIPYPAEKDGSPLHLVFGFVLPRQLSLSFELLDLVFASHDGALLTRPFLDQGLATQVETYLDTQVRQPYYLVILKGVKDEKKARALFEELLERYSKESIDPVAIGSSFHQLSFHKLDISHSQHGAGLQLLMKACFSAYHEEELIDTIKIKEPLDRLEEELKDRFYLNRLIQRHLFENTHRIYGRLEPDLKLLQKEQLPLDCGEERGLFEEQPLASCECLPILDLKKIPLDPLEYSLEKKQILSTSIFQHQTSTRGIAYVKLFLELPKLSDEELFNLQLLEDLFEEVSSKSVSYRERLLRIDATVASFSSDLLLVGQKLYLVLEAKALERHLEDLFFLFEETLTQLRMDEKERILEVLEAVYDHLITSIPNSSARYASLRALSRLHPAGALLEQLKGVTYIHRLKSWIANFKQDPEPLLVSLEKSYSRLKEARRELVITYEKPIQSIGALSSLPLPSLDESPLFSIEPFGREAHFEMLSFPMGSSANVLLLQAPDSFSPKSPYMLLGACLMKHKKLHPLIREIQGAYGAGARYHPELGSLTLFSSSDPEIEATYNIFIQTLDFFGQLAPTEEELVESKLSTLQHLSHPIPLEGRAEYSFILEKQGKSFLHRKEYRRQVLEATWDEIKKACRFSLENHQKVTVAAKSKIIEISYKNPKLTYTEI